MQLFGREDELAKLRTWVRAARPFLFHGPVGVGKTRLLDELSPEMPPMLRISGCNTPQALFHEVAVALWKRGSPDLRRRLKSLDQLKSVSVTSLKGLCLEALHASRYTLVLEHVGFSSQQFSGAIKQLAGESELPLIFVARSCHMEDSGYLVRHFPDRSERLELQDFGSSKAEEFARRVADEAQLTAENLTEFLSKVSELSGGNPGAIVSMVRMASAPRYRSGDWIKSTPLYIDFRLARNASV
jgi:AAA+ ATPase superfamily predicted ATPase